jgi:lipopolysaccharide heptosyltransferase II
VGKKIRENGTFDAGVLFTNSLRSALEFKFAGIPHIVGYDGHHRRRFLHQIIEPPQGRRPPEHQVRRYLRLAARVGADVTGDGISPVAVPLPASGRSPGRIRIGLCPGAEYGSAKRWPAENFTEVANEIFDRGIDAEWVLFGVASEVAIGEMIEDKLKGICANLIGKTTLAQAIAEIQTCRVMLTNDTGTMHLAAHLGVPSVAIFGPTEPALTHPIGGGHTVVRHHVECSPCFLRECPLDWRCMKEVTPREVTWAVLHKLREQGQLPGD